MLRNFPSSTKMLVGTLLFQLNLVHAGLFGILPDEHSDSESPASSYIDKKKEQIENVIKPTRLTGLFNRSEVKQMVGLSYMNVQSGDYTNILSGSAAGLVLSAQGTNDWGSRFSIFESISKLTLTDTTQYGFSGYNIELVYDINIKNTLLLEPFFGLEKTFLKSSTGSISDTNAVIFGVGLGYILGDSSIIKCNYSTSSISNDIKTIIIEYSILI
jgi:hypothetical protein